MHLHLSVHVTFGTSGYSPTQLSSSSRRSGRPERRQLLPSWGPAAGLKRGTNLADRCLGVVLHVPPGDPHEDPSGAGEVLFSGDVPDDLGLVRMAFAFVFDSHPVFGVGQVRLTHDAGPQHWGVTFSCASGRPTRSSARRRRVSGAESAPTRACSRARRALRIPGVPLWRSSISAKSPRVACASLRPSKSGRGIRSRWSATTVSSSTLIRRAISSHVPTLLVTRTPCSSTISSAKNWPRWPVTPRRLGMATLSGRDMWMPGSSAPGRKPGYSHSRNAVAWDAAERPVTRVTARPAAKAAGAHSGEGRRRTSCRPPVPGCRGWA